MLKAVFSKELIGKDTQILEDVPELQTLQEKVKFCREWSNIPKRYLNAEYKPNGSGQALVWEKFILAFNGKLLDAMSDVLILGKVGTGKTHLSISLLNILINQGMFCKYSTEYNLLDLSFQKKYAEFESFKKVDILVIDELGKRQLLDWQMIQIEELISYRYNEMLPTIYISNLNTIDFKKFVGDRVTDRLRDNRVITAILDGDSFRGEQNHE